jgi:hypothetical protein
LIIDIYVCFRSIIGFVFKTDSKDEVNFSFHSFIMIKLKISTDVNKKLNRKRNIDISIISKMTKKILKSN